MFELHKTHELLEIFGLIKKQCKKKYKIHERPLMLKKTHIIEKGVKNCTRKKFSS